jgi:phosphatidylglycerol lysyltransferase
MRSARLNTLRPERFLAIFTGIMAVINLISAVTPALIDRLQILEEIIPMQVRSGTRLATALAGFALILLASGIWRGKRAAWWVTLSILILSTITHVVKGLDFEEASVSLLLIIGLLVFRRRFVALSDAPTIARGLQTLGIALGFTLLYGTIGLSQLDKHFSVNFNLWQAAYQTIRMFTEFSNPGLIVTTRFGRYFSDSIYLIGGITLAYALLTLLAPVLLRRPTDPGELEQATTIVQKYGQTVLARFCLFPDKKYFFSAGGSLIAYTYSNLTAVVLGDPVGPATDTLTIVKEFQKFCSRNDWMLTFYQTRPDTLEAYHQAGLHEIKIGEEAVVDLANFSLKGGEVKSLRTSVNKLERLGYSCPISQPPHDEKFLDELKTVSDEWMLGRKGKEMKFSLGWFDRDYLNTTLIQYAADPEGKVVAFANLVDEYQNRELAVDLMRQKRELPAGTMDYLFINLLLEAQKRGYERFNLGLSGLAGVGELKSDPAVERAMHYIYANVTLAYNFKGLHSFKEKFNPTWLPRYLIYPNLTVLPVIALAVNEVGG